MRNFNTSDIFEAARIIKKYNLKETLTPIIKKAEKEEADLEEIGVEVLVAVMSDEKTEKAFYEIMARPLEIEPKEISQMDIDVILEKIIELNLIRFFKLAGQLNLK